MGWLHRELRASCRRHRRALASTICTIAVLSTANSVSSAVFALIDGVILKPLPYARPDRLVIVHGASEGAPRRALSGPAIDDLRFASQAFGYLEPYVSGGTALLGTDGTLNVQVTCGRPALFQALGARPMLGRLFSEGATDEVLVSHRLWHGRFGGGRPRPRAACHDRGASPASGRRDAAGLLLSGRWDGCVVVDFA